MSALPENQSGKILIQLQDATFARLNAPPFKNINWRLRENETWAITGPVGAGKSTFAEALTGKFPIQKGSIIYHFLPEEENNAFQARKHIVLVSFQPNAPALNYGKYYYQQRYNSSDTDDIITLQDFLRGTPGLSANEQKLNAVVKLLGISDLLPLEVIKLSNGQTRKMLIARALLQEPILLILDNPFAGLDVQTRQDLNNLINNLVAQGTKIILVTDQAHIPENITHVLLLEDFAIRKACARKEFMNTPEEKNISETTANSNGATYLFPTKAHKPDFEIAVRFTDTTVKYDDKTILNKINWTIKRGEKWALVGPNGSGKTTLLSLINADNPQAFANKIYLFDRRKGSGESIWDIKKRIGFVSPELHLYFRQNLTGETVAATGFFDTLYLNKKLDEAQEQLLAEFFSFYQLEHLRVKSFLRMSSGEQRLVLLIRSLLKNPDLLIWDEPFQGLSPNLIKKSLDLLTAYANPDKTVIFVSHYNTEIPVWIDKIISLEKGNIKSIKS